MAAPPAHAHTHHAHTCTCTHAHVHLQVREVLWQHHRQLYGAHEYYSTLYSEVETTAGSK